MSEGGCGFVRCMMFAGRVGRLLRDGAVEVCGEVHLNVLVYWNHEKMN